MKKIKNLTLVLSSFIAGMAFIISCGGSLKGVAGEALNIVANAIEIAFDNTDTSLDSTTTQGAIEEMANAIPFVRDANGQKVGLFIGFSDNHDFQIIELKTKAPIRVNRLTGSILGDRGKVVYTSSDCTGTPYFPFGDTSYAYVNGNNSDGTSAQIEANKVPIFADGKIYWYSSVSNQIKPSEIHSYKEYNYSEKTTPCTAWASSDPDPTTEITSSILYEFDDQDIIRFLPAAELDLQPYAGPLSIY